MQCLHTLYLGEGVHTSIKAENKRVGVNVGNQYGIDTDFMSESTLLSADDILPGSRSSRQKWAKENTMSPVVSLLRLWLFGVGKHRQQAESSFAENKPPPSSLKSEM